MKRVAAFQCIDILDAMRRIVEIHTATYKEDFDEDASRLSAAAQNASVLSLEDLTFLWMVRKNGTYCIPERNVFLCNTSGNVIWEYYSEGIGAEDDILAYAVIVKGMQNGHITGELYPLDYAEHAEHVHAAAQPAVLHAVFEKGEEQYDIPKSGIVQSAPQVHSRYGHLKDAHIEPKDQSDMRHLLQDEALKRKKARIGDIDKHIRSLSRREHRCIAAKGSSAAHS